MSTHSEIAIGVDVGGTTTRVAVVDADGRVVSSRRGPTPSDGRALVHWIADGVREVISESASKGNNAACMGVALPGIVDRAKGELVRSVNLATLEGRRIIDELEEQVGLRAVLMTDAEAATWGEYVASPTPGDGFAHLRLGTGIACGVVRHGRLMPTDPARKTHWDMLVVDQSADAAACPCGLRGCLEMIASGRVLEEKARAIGLPDGIGGLQTAFAAGRIEAVAIVRRAARAVGTAVANLAREFHVGTVAIGGGVIERLPCLLADISEASVSQQDERLRATFVAVGSTRLGDDAGVIGAALLASAASFDS
jgi:glucokinase